MANRNRYAKKVRQVAVEVYGGSVQIEFSNKELTNGEYSFDCEHELFDCDMHGDIDNRKAHRVAQTDIPDDCTIDVYCYDWSDTGNGLEGNMQAEIKNGKLERIYDYGGWDEVTDTCSVTLYWTEELEAQEKAEEAEYE